MTRDMIQAIRALRWRKGSTRRSDTSVTKIAYSSLSLAVAVGLGAGMRLRNFWGSGKPIAFFCPCSKGDAVCSSAFMGRDCAEEIDFARKLATGFAAEGIYGGLTLPAFNGQLVRKLQILIGHF